MSDNPPTPRRGEDEWRRSEYPRMAELDPAGEPKGSVFSTVYVPDELLINGEGGLDVSGRIRELRAIARRAGWELDELDLEDERPKGRSQSRRARLTIAPTDVTRVTAETPDAWQVLRQARRDGVGEGVSLNHILSTDSMNVNPFTANPFTANPFTANPFTANPFTANPFTANAGVGIRSYASLGFGGRQPITYLGPAPSFEKSRSRPVVAIFDTGLGAHPWFAGDVVIAPVLSSGEPIGIIRDATDPERHPSLAVPLDGIFDDAAGHGTFIAGIIRQRSPEARILPVRVADGEGVIVESELIGALARLIEFIEQGNRVDVLNLSFSYYSETPDDPDAISELRSLLEQLRVAHGVVVVCSAGNEATDRPTFPAAMTADRTRHVCVGALNPASRSVALFSNIGAWVDVYAPGVSLVSTVPIDFDGGIQAGTRDDLYGRKRTTLDPDDFRGGFGVWSGTSFAAPVVAGSIAARIAGGDDGAKATKAVLDSLGGDDRSHLP